MNMLNEELKARVTVRLEYDLDNDNRWTVAIENKSTISQEDWVCILASEVHSLIVEAQDVTDHPVEYGELEDFRNALEVYVDPLLNFNNGHKCKKSTKRQLANISTKSTVDKLDILASSLEFFIEVSEEFLKHSNDEERSERLRAFNETRAAKVMMNEISELRETIDAYLR